MKNLEELSKLEEAAGLMLLTTASVEQACVAIEKVPCQKVGRDHICEGMIWMGATGMEDRGGGVTEYPREDFRLHPHKGKVDVHLEKDGFVTRIDFFIPRPTKTPYRVAGALLEAGFTVAVPTPADINVLINWAIFTSVEGEPKIQRVA